MPFLSSIRSQNHINISLKSSPRGEPTYGGGLEGEKSLPLHNEERTTHLIEASDSPEAQPRAVLSKIFIFRCSFSAMGVGISGGIAGFVSSKQHYFTGLGQRGEEKLGTAYGTAAVRGTCGRSASLSEACGRMERRSGHQSPAWNQWRYLRASCFTVDFATHFSSSGSITLMRVCRSILAWM